MYAAETICLGLFYILTYTPTASQLPDTYRVAGLFEEKYRGIQKTFENTIEKINLRSDIIANQILIFGIQNVKEQDSFEASKKACREIKEGVAAIFGPVSRVSASHMQSICNSLNIPHVQAHWDPRDNFNNLFSINLYPHYLSLSRAYLDIVRYWKWRSFTILYEDNDGLIRLQELLKASQGTTDSSPMKITVRKIDASVDNYVKMWKEMKARLEYKVIIDCHHTTAEKLLLEAQKVCMVSDYNHFHFTTLDLGLVELEQFSHAGANITAFRLVDPAKPNVMQVTDDWVFEELNKRESPLQGQKQIPTDVALMYDAVHLFARALHELSKAKDVTTQALSCSKDKKWTDGISLLNYMKTIDFEGLTGRVHYDNGKRTEFSLDVVELSGIGLLKVGTWDPRNKINITTSSWKLPGEKPLANKTLRVVTVEDEPYTILKTKDREPNHPYEGYCVDLLEMLSKRLGFNYTIYKSPKNEYGNCDKIPKNCKGPGKKDCEYEYKNCNGLVGELVAGKADIAVAGMTITYDREQVVDFTKPFLNLGITILFKKPAPEPPKLFSFLEPLSMDVWIYMIAGYLCVSFMLFVIARFTPYEWTNPHPCNQDTDVVENQFSILNSLWFTIGALMQQGCEIAPQAVSTRLIAGIWWFFTLIMISSYTANLAAFLTVERMVPSIESAEDLAKQSKIKYGTLTSGSTRRFFAESENPVYQTMSAFMENDESLFVNSSDSGKERVLSGDYAYFAESAWVEYTIQRECELMQVGSWLDSKGYGIAVAPESPYRDAISDQILKLSEQQQLHKLYDKWWKSGKCSSEKPKTSSALGVKNVGGVFVLLIGGMIMGFIVAMFEFVWKARKNARHDKQSLCSEMAEEFRFAIRCLGSSKKTLKATPSKDIMDNGLQSMPLHPNHSGCREVFA